MTVIPVSRPLSTRDVMSIVAVILIWGINFIPMKLGLRDFTPLQLGAARFLFAALPLVFLLRPPKIGWRWLMAYGLVQGLGQFGFLFFALHVGMTAALASVLMQTHVFFTALLTAVFLRERIGRALGIGMALAAAGLVCFALQVLRTDGAAGVTMAGLALNLAAAFMWATANIIVKAMQADRPPFSPLALIVWSSLVAAVAFALLSFVFDPVTARRNWLEASMVGWCSAAYIGWAANLVGYGLWTTLLHRHHATRIAPFSLGMPVVGLLAGMLVLDEVVDLMQWTGAILVMSALVCVVLGSSVGQASRT